MPEQLPTALPTEDYAALSEAARSLARTLQAAPAQESRSLAALRSYLISVSQALATLCDTSAEVVGSDPHRACHTLVTRLRRMAADLAFGQPAVPPGIAVVVAVFAERLAPETLLLLQPHGGTDYAVREHLDRFQQLLREVGLDEVRSEPGIHMKSPSPLQGEGQGVRVEAPTSEGIPFPPDCPRQCLVLRYPQGAQDNVLLSCNLLRALYPGPKRLEGFEPDAFATAILGPAYFFAFASEIGTPQGHGDAYQLPRLCHVAELLRGVGWFEHTVVGPLLNAWYAHFGFDSEYLSRRIQSSQEESLSAARDLFQRPGTGLRAYQPHDFDRDVPLLWDRLRQLLPPNDLDIDAVESMLPAAPVSILNAGWSFHLLWMEDLYRILGSKTPEDRYEAKQVLNRLLTKGVELSRIAQLWSAAREEATH